MSDVMIVEPMAISAIAASRGTGADNLRMANPKEAWIDTAVATPATITVDLGRVRLIDTILLAYVAAPAANARWSIEAGEAGAAERIVQPDALLRVPDVTDEFAERTHALWTGVAFSARYVRLTLTQPAGTSPLSAGVIVVGKAFVAELGREWGSGRRPIDTGTATALSSGGFAIVDGARKSSFAWTFGDLSDDETDRLEGIGRRLGSTRPGVVIEDANRTAGLAARIHYGLFDTWRAFDRRERAQTKWDIGIQQWT